MSTVVDFLKALAGICRTEALSPQLWRMEEGKATIELSQVPQLQDPGGAVYLSGKGLKVPILVVKGDDGEFHCFSNRCTHMGRKLDPTDGQPSLRCCSVSHSTFDHAGNVTSGPAKGAIPLYQCGTRDGNLEILI